MKADIDVKKLVNIGVGLAGDPSVQVKKAKSKGTATPEKIVKNIKG